MFTPYEPRIPTGWRLISHEENVAIWKQFTATFQFLHGVDAPTRTRAGIVLPKGARSYDARQIFEIYDLSQDEFQIHERALERWVNAAMFAGYPEEEVFALSLNHPGYSFQPIHPSEEMSSDPSLWPVWLTPAGEYTCFVSRDLSHGTFGHPWLGVISIWGERLVSYSSSTPPSLLAPI